MKRSRFSEEQIAYALRLAESGTPVVDVYRQVSRSVAAVACSDRRADGRTEAPAGTYPHTQGMRA